MASRLEQLKKQQGQNKEKQSTTSDYSNILDTIMNRPNESKLKDTDKEIVDIDVEMIDTDDVNERLFGLEDLSRIEKSFDTIGNISIIYVFRRTSGRYLCFAGNQRLIATKNRGEKTITCAILGDEPSVEKRIEYLIFMNAQRTMKPYYIGQQISEYESILRRKGVFNVSDMIEEQFGYGTRMQQRYKSILKLDDSLQELFKRDDIPFKYLLEKCTKLPEGKEGEFADTFLLNAANQDVSVEMIDKTFASVTKIDVSKPVKPSYKKTTQVFKELTSLPYYKDEQIEIPENKKQLIKEQACIYKSYLEKVIEACE